MNDTNHSGGATATAGSATGHAGDDKTIVERAQGAAGVAADKVSTAAGTAAEKVSSAAGTAATATGNAAKATLDAIKEHPVAAAGIAAGVAAAAAGVAYGVSKLNESDKPAGGRKTTGAGASKSTTKSSPAKK